MRGLAQNWRAFAILAGVMLLADLNRYAGLEAVTTTHGPVLPLAMLAVAATGATAILIIRWQLSGRSDTRTTV